MPDDERLPKYEFVPEALWGKFPGPWILLLERSCRILGEGTMLTVAYCALYGTLVGQPHTSEWLYLLVAGLGPWAVAFWYVRFPLNIYRTAAARGDGMKDLDQKDPDAKAFVALLRSSEARRFLMARARQLSLLFLVPMVVISAGMQVTPIWRFGADCVVRIPMFMFLSLFFLFRLELLNWALKSWKAAEDRNQ